jgi:4-hydroxy-3-methylbut-2-enyl diphosphate reductase
MRISMVEGVGFCFGVKRAIKMASDAAQNGKNKVYTLGPLIHNPQVVEALRKKGVEVAENLNKIKRGTIIIRSHGVHPKVISQAKKKGLKIVDATCPFVKTAQSKAKSLQDQNYQVIVVGEADHPEVKGIVGYSRDKALVLNHRMKNYNFSKFRKLGVVAQTTLNLSTFKKAVDRLLETSKEIKIYNTICSATATTQSKSLKLAREVSLMLVVGGRNSANTSRLARLCQEAGTKTYHVETAEELNKSWFKGVKRVGITAGSSTPEWIIQEVAKEVRKINKGN